MRPEFEMGSLVMREMSGIPAAFLGRQWMVAWTRVVDRRQKPLVTSILSELLPIHGTSGRTQCSRCRWTEATKEAFNVCLWSISCPLPLCHHETARDS